MKNIWDEYAVNAKGKERFKNNLEKNSESRDWIFDKINSLWGCKTVLEIGCGLGLGLHNLDLNKINEYYGVDQCENFVNNLIGYYKDVESIKFLHDDCEKIKADKFDKFDMVYCRHVLEHISNPFEVLDEMIKISKRYIIIGFFRIDNNETNIGTIRSNEYGEYIQNTFNEKEVLDFFETRGLKIKDTFEINNNKNFLLKK